MRLTGILSRSLSEKSPLDKPEAEETFVIDSIKEINESEYDRIKDLLLRRAHKHRRELIPGEESITADSLPIPMAV